MARKSYRQTHITVNEWEPVDASGAGLTFLVFEAFYQVVGGVVMFSVDLVVPANGNGNNFTLGGLAEVATRFGFSSVGSSFPSVVNTTFSAPLQCWSPDGQTFILLPFGGVPKTNADLSGKEIALQGNLFMASS